MNPKYLLVTSSGTPDNLNLSEKHFHRLGVRAGFSCCEHHYVITRDGKSHQTRPTDSVGVPLSDSKLKKLNKDCISVLLVGTKNYSAAQLNTLWALLYVYLAEQDPLRVISHSQLCKDSGLKDSGKPGFDLNDFITERLTIHDHA